MAWKALQAYFSDSAVEGGDVPGLEVEEGEENRDAGPGLLAGRADDDEGRREEVRDADALAQELGEHRGADVPAGERAAKTGETTWSTVPGRHRAADDHRVEAEAGGAAWVMASRISAAARGDVGEVGLALAAGRRADADQGQVGVLDGLGRGRRRPRAAGPAAGGDRPTIPGSTTGLSPALIAATLAASTSTPTTECPQWARPAAVTVPTYPRPKTANFMTPPGDSNDCVMGPLDPDLCVRVARRSGGGLRRFAQILKTRGTGHPRRRSEGRGRKSWWSGPPWSSPNATAVRSGVH